MQPVVAWFLVVVGNQKWFHDITGPPTINGALPNAQRGGLAATSDHISCF